MSRNTVVVPPGGGIIRGKDDDGSTATRVARDRTRAMEQIGGKTRLLAWHLPIGTIWFTGGM